MQYFIITMLLFENEKLNLIFYRDHSFEQRKQAIRKKVVQRVYMPIIVHRAHTCIGSNEGGLRKRATP